MFYRIIRQCVFGPLIVNSVKVTFPAAYSFSVLIHRCFSPTHACVYWWKSVNLHLSDPRNNAALNSSDLWTSSSKWPQPPFLTFQLVNCLEETTVRVPTSSNLSWWLWEWNAASAGWRPIHGCPANLQSPSTQTGSKRSRLWSPVRSYSWNPHPGPNLL